MASDANRGNLRVPMRALSGTPLRAALVAFCLLAYSCAPPSPPPTSNETTAHLPVVRVEPESATLNWAEADARPIESTAMVERQFFRQKQFSLGEDDTKLRRVALEVKENPDFQVNVIAYASDSRNEESVLLADRRARAVTEYFQNLGVQSRQISVKPVEDVPQPVGGHAEGFGEHVKITLTQKTPALESVLYYWNAWVDPAEKETEIASPSFEPIEILEPDHEYLLNLHLSGLQYKAPGVRRFEVERQLRKIIDDNRPKKSVKELVFQVVLLTDERAFTTPSQVVESFRIDMEKIRNFTAQEYSEFDDPLQVLRSEGDADFLFGRLPEIRIRTTTRTGATAIGLSFWTNGRPVEELSIPFCVGSDADSACPDGHLATTTLGGSGILDSAGDSGSSISLPDAALHVIELNGGNLFGVFHRNDNAQLVTPVESYLVWPIRDSALSFGKQLGNLQDQFGRLRQTPLSVGRDLSNLLFGGDSDRAKEAKKAFTQFFSEHRRSRPFESSDPGTIFVRMILQNLPRPWLYPLGLLNLDGQESGFLGYHLRVETPLPRQSYGRPEACLSNWIPVFPVEYQDQPLKQALRAVESDDRITLNSIGTAMNYRVIKGRPTVPILPNMTKFHGWIGDDRSMDSAPILSILSHHNEESLYFATDRPHINSSSIQRPMPGSVAILSGCSTGKLGSTGIVRALNDRGVDSIISTNTGITGSLAGDFLTCLSRTLERAPPGSDLEVGIAFSRAQRCLFNEHQTEEATPRSLYAHHVLSFTLVGNSEVKLCGPQ